MTPNEVGNSIALKKRFCKDNNVPISLFDTPYFDQRLNLISQNSQGEKYCDKWLWFIKDLEAFETEQDYFTYYNSVKDSAIQTIKETEDFDKFIHDNSITYYLNDYGKRNLYVDQNDGKIFISIDMNKANFTALNYYSSNIFGKAKTWEEFISRFTDMKHIINSKYIRQVILGTCNPKRQIKFEEYLTVKMANILKYSGNIFPTIYSVGFDEIIIEVPKDCGYSFNDILQLKNAYPVGELYRAELFELHKLPNGYGWYKTYYKCEDWSKLYAGVEFKCVPSEIYNQVLKHWLGVPINKDDLVFYHNGQLAQFLEPIQNPWE